MSEKHFIGDYVTSFDDVKKRKPISRVTLMYDDENGFTAGDDTGLEVVASCYFATQAMADNALAALQGYQYHPFSAGSANLDPAAELGDGVTVGGIYSVIAGLSDNGYGFPDVEAPGEEELEEEFPHPGFLTQEVKRKVALGRSYYGTRITRANGLEVVKTEADGTEKSRVKLSSDILAFYNDDEEEALYFDAEAGKYRFRGDVEVTGGSMNINDNFIVDEDGNVQLNGSITIAGSLTMTGESNWVQVRYSTDSAATVPSGWTEEWDSDWNNTSTQVWAIYSYDGGSTWSQPMLAQGKTGAQGPAGEDGEDGSDANVPSWVEAYTNSAEYNTLVSNEWVVSMNLYSSNIFGGSYYDIDGIGKLTLALSAARSVLAYPMMDFSGEVNGEYRSGFSVGIDSENGYIGVTIGNGISWESNVDSYWTDGIGWYADVIARGRHTFAHEAIFAGTVDFSRATVTGLDIVFG